MTECISLAQVRILSPRGKYRFSTRAQLQMTFQGPGGTALGQGFSWASCWGRQSCPISFVPLCTWLSSGLAGCAHAHPPLPETDFRVKQLRRGETSELSSWGRETTQHSYPPVSYLASCPWPAPSPRLHCTDNGIIWASAGKLVNCHRFLIFPWICHCVFINFSFSRNSLIYSTNVYCGGQVCWALEN